MKNKILSIVLIMTLLLTSVGGVFADTIATTKQLMDSTDVIVIDLEDLDEYPEIKKMMIKQGQLSQIEKQSQQNENSILVTEHNKEIFSLNSTERIFESKFDDANTFSQDKPTDYEIKDISNKYGISIPKEFASNEVKLIVASDYATRGVGIWALNYITTSVSFSVFCLNLGEPLTNVRGTITKYGMNRTTWEYKDSETFNKPNVGSGMVFTWLTPVYSVKEKFEYDITVIGGIIPSRVTNVGENDKVRYNFGTGQYYLMASLGGEKHHFVSSAALIANNYSKWTAPAMRMLYADHRKTPSCGGGSASYIATEKSLLSSKQYQQLLQYEVNGMKNTADTEGVYSNLQLKYYDEIIVMLFEYEKLFGMR